MEGKGLSARELLEGVYQNLKNDGKEIVLPTKAMAVIADDSDWHKKNIGYTGYESAIVVEVEGKEWAIAFGTKCGSYPADSYNCDIAAVKLSSEKKSDKEVAIEIHDALIGNWYFRNSLIYAMADGNLGLKNGPFGPKVLELLEPKAQEFVAKDVEVNPNLIGMDLRPVVESEMQYKPGFADFLYDIFRKVLAS